MSLDNFPKQASNKTEDIQKDIENRVEKTTDELIDMLEQYDFEVERLSEKDGIAYNADKNITIVFSCTAHCDFATAAFNKTKDEVLAEYFKDTEDRKMNSIGGWGYRKHLEDEVPTGPCLCNHDHTLGEIKGYLDRI